MKGRWKVILGSQIWIYYLDFGVMTVESRVEKKQSGQMPRSGARASGRRSGMPRAASSTLNASRAGVSLTIESYSTGTRAIPFPFPRRRGDAGDGDGVDGGREGGDGAGDPYDGLPAQAHGPAPPRPLQAHHRRSTRSMYLPTLPSPPVGF